VSERRGGEWNKMSIVDRLLNLDQRIIYALMFIALAFPILNPVIMPMSVQDYSQKAFDFSDSIPEGSIVIFEGGLGAATYPQGGPGMVAQIYHMLTKGVKIVFFSIGTEQNVWTMTAIETALEKLPAGTPAERGVDWVHLGYVAGQESGVGSLVNDIRATLQADYFDTPIDDIPLLEGINDATAFSAVLWWGGSEGSMPYGIRQISVPFGIPITGMCTTNEVPNFSPYISAGQLQGLFGGVRGSAEYEYLLKLPGPALGQAMATNFGGLLWLILVILGNVLYFLTRSRGEA
jgi:hypothetical protein